MAAVLAAALAWLPLSLDGRWLGGSAAAEPDADVLSEIEQIMEFLAIGDQMPPGLQEKFEVLLAEWVTVNAYIDGPPMSFNAFLALDESVSPEETAVMLWWFWWIELNIGPWWAD